MRKQNKTNKRLHLHPEGESKRSGGKWGSQIDFTSRKTSDVGNLRGATKRDLLPSTEPIHLWSSSLDRHCGRHIQGESKLSLPHLRLTATCHGYVERHRCSSYTHVANGCNPSNPQITSSITMKARRLHLPCHSRASMSLVEVIIVELKLPLYNS